MFKIGFDHIQEHVLGTDEIFQGDGSTLSSIPINFLSIDIANLENKIGIEVDGPAHFVNILDSSDDKEKKQRTAGYAKRMGSKMGWQFLTNSRRQVNRPSALKHRLLCHLGFCVIHMPYYDWQELNGDPENQSLYCTELLQEVIE